MSYKYDIFFSYKHSEGLKLCSTDTFLTGLRAATRELLNRDLDVFLDLDEIESDEDDIGQIVTTLGSGLAHSRCMVAVWSSSYFYSVWCRSEVETRLATTDGDFNMVADHRIRSSWRRRVS